ncbi:MAG TPA: c-type cytochrome, partial [Bryobacteraceae bacterium]|nr:c-type cytochrome [Bryobacteraceae bacterium]
MIRSSYRRPALIASGCAATLLACVYGLRGADQPVANPAPVFQQYCVGCHNDKLSTAGISLEKLIAAPSVAENYQAWERVSAMLGQKRMPPAGMPQPNDEQRAHAVGWIHSQLDAYIQAHAG